MCLYIYLQQIIYILLTFWYLVCLYFVHPSFLNYIHHVCVIICLAYAYIFKIIYAPSHLILKYFFVLLEAVDDNISNAFYDHFYSIFSSSYYLFFLHQRFDIIL